MKEETEATTTEATDWTEVWHAFVMSIALAAAVAAGSDQ